MKDVYSISGWYTYNDQNVKIPQAGCFMHDPKTSEINHGFIYDARWGYADIEGTMDDEILHLRKAYGDGSDNVLYTLHLNNYHGTGTWKAEKHAGTAEVWIARLANAENFSFDKARLHEKTKYVRKRRHE